MQTRSLWYKKIFFYLKSGQSVADALKNSNTDRYIEDITKKVLSGEKLSTACVSCKDDIFTSTEVSLIQTAEYTGTLQKVSIFLSDVLKNWYTQKQKLFTMAIYPCVVLLLTVGLLVGILGFIVPKIKPLFSDLPHIPFTTKLLMWGSDMFLSYWSTGLLMCIVFLLIHVSISKHRVYEAYLKKIKTYILLHTPYIKDVYIFWNIDRWTHVFSICLENNISLEQSFSLATQTIENEYIKASFLKSLTKIQQGVPCSDSLSELPDTIYKNIKDWYSVIRSGESSSSLKDVFNVFYVYMHEQLTGLFEKTQKYIEPALILGIGGIVLLVAVSIILPMYQLTQSIQ